MKKLFYLLVISFLVNSCDKKTPSNCPEPELDCTTVRCLIYNYNFDFRIVDKNTGADLVFGTSPRYTESDVALFLDAAQTIPVSLTSDAGQKIFSTSQANEVMYLVIAGTTSYKITVDFKKVNCCLSRVKNLSVNGKTVCTCCADAIEVPVL
ncbi:MAG TPA: hypothetical protein PKC72_03685 [Chitinophagaceae bacterium]|nr:hypothetical protein [Chitinophagaceae bacterium]